MRYDEGAEILFRVVMRYSSDNRYAHDLKKCESHSINNLHLCQGNSMTTGCPKISHKCNNNMEKIGDPSSTTKDLLEIPNVD